MVSPDAFWSAGAGSCVGAAPFFSSGMTDFDDANIVESRRNGPVARGLTGALFRRLRSTTLATFSFPNTQMQPTTQMMGTTMSNTTIAAMISGAIALLSIAIARSTAVSGGDGVGDNGGGVEGAAGGSGCGGCGG